MLNPLSGTNCGFVFQPAVTAQVHDLETAQRHDPAHEQPSVAVGWVFFAAEDCDAVTACPLDQSLYSAVEGG
jgi:hypothetical protein